MSPTYLTIVKQHENHKNCLTIKPVGYIAKQKNKFFKEVVK